MSDSRKERRVAKSETQIPHGWVAREELKPAVHESSPLFLAIGSSIGSFENTCALTSNCTMEIDIESIEAQAVFRTRVGARNC